MPPRRVFFCGQGEAPYHLAEVIIKFINNMAEVIDNDSAVRRANQNPVPARI